MRGKLEGESSGRKRCRAPAKRELYDPPRVLIFDDLFSELDAQVSQRLLGLFAQLQNQIFVTSTTRPEKLDTKSCSFQVVQGQFV
jgi:recombinational DNA repair ATPase RecF